VCWHYEVNFAHNLTEIFWNEMTYSAGARYYHWRTYYCITQDHKLTSVHEKHFTTVISENNQITKLKFFICVIVKNTGRVNFIGIKMFFVQVYKELIIYILCLISKELHSSTVLSLITEVLILHNCKQLSHTMFDFKRYKTADIKHTDTNMSKFSVEFPKFRDKTVSLTKQFHNKTVSRSNVSQFATKQFRDETVSRRNKLNIWFNHRPNLCSLLPLVLRLA